MFADTHCHLDFDAYDADRPEVIARARQAGLKFIINPGVDLPSASAVLKLTEDYKDYIFAAVGIHPNYTAECASDILPLLRNMAAAPGVVAIGGTWMVSPKLVQAGNWSAIARLTTEAVAIAREAAK